MPARQLRLFPPAQPLLDRLGADFFKSIPRQPGVYVMRDDQDNILYIGQSKNLWARLRAYRNSRPEAMPRKTVRLIHQVRSIAFQCCPTPAAAEALETRLLQQHRPRFNRAKTWPATCFRIGMWRSGSGGTLRLALGDGRPLPPGVKEPSSGLPWLMPEESATDLKQDWFGPFQGQGMGRHLFRALVRLIWACLNQPTTPLAFPLPFSGRLSQWTFAAPAPPREAAQVLPALQDPLRLFFNGQSTPLVELTKWLLLDQSPRPGSCLEVLYRHDLETLETSHFTSRQTTSPLAFRQ